MTKAVISTCAVILIVATASEAFPQLTDSDNLEDENATIPTTYVTIEPSMTTDGDSSATTELNEDTSEPAQDEDIPEPDQPIDKSFISRLRTMVVDLVTDDEFQKIALALVATAFGSAMEWMRRKSKDLQRRLSGPRFSLPATSVESVNRVLQVGLGGSGKTTLIKTITAHPDVDPRIRTSKVRTYSLVHELTTNKVQHVCRIDIDDYRGQRIGDLVKEWGNRKKRGEDLKIHSLVFVVDLFYPPGPTETLAPTNEVDPKRISEHLKEWSAQAVDAVMSLSSIRANYICLFINKVDLLVPCNEQSLSKINESFRPLIEIISTQSSGALFEVIIGSATTGERVPEVVHRFIERAEVIGDKRSV